MHTIAKTKNKRLMTDLTWKNATDTEKEVLKLAPKFLIFKEKIFIINIGIISES